MSSNSNKSNNIRKMEMEYLSNLKNIYNYYFDDEDELIVVFNYENDMLAFIEAFNVSAYQARVLAYLVHYNNSRISGAKLLSFYDCGDCVTAREEITALYNRQFIDRHEMTNGNICYYITEKAMDSFKNGGRVIKIEKKKFSDCYSELSTVSLKNILSNEWRATFYDSVNASEDHQIAEALDKLGVKKWKTDVQDAFWVLVRQFARRFTIPFAFRYSGGPLSDIDYDESKLKQAMGELVKMGLAVTIPIEPLEDTKDTERYVISVKAVELLFHGHEEFVRYEEISKQANVILAKDIDEKKLFFPEKSQKEVDNLRKLLTPEGFKRAKGILLKQKRNPGIQSLFWGPPGTGKTEVIKQLARESGRDIVMYDAAKATASAWGASEKSYRALFLGYAYLVAVSDNAPILMLNEADQLLCKRLTDVDSAIARAENTVSNIVLQGFEDMSGILLATTNLAKNMDEAFDRRFLFKTELVKPDASTRRKIWKSSIPELSDEEAGKLAERFDMSGAQINNVVAKRNLAELYYEGDRDINYITELCKEEIEEPIKGSSRKVGY